MTLLEKQFEFSFLLAELILQAQSMDYKVTLGEAYRSDETAKLDEQEGKGINHSLHRLRLAIDINLFQKVGTGWVYLRNTEDYRALGEWWEDQSLTGVTCRWGGRFDDGNHFSLEHNGIE